MSTVQYKLSIYTFCRILDEATGLEFNIDNIQYHLQDNGRYDLSKYDCLYFDLIIWCIEKFIQAPSFVNKCCFKLLFIFLELQNILFYVYNLCLLSDLFKDILLRTDIFMHAVDPKTNQVVDKRKALRYVIYLTFLKHSTFIGYGF